jgi:hypothetical protein
MIDTIIPAILYITTTLILFGMVCFTWGYLKGRDACYIEVKTEKKTN